MSQFRIPNSLSPVNARASADRPDPAVASGVTLPAGAGGLVPVADAGLLPADVAVLPVAGAGLPLADVASLVPVAAAGLPLVGAGEPPVAGAGFPLADAGGLPVGAAFPFVELPAVGFPPVLAGVASLPPAVAAGPVPFPPP